MGCSGRPISKSSYDVVIIKRINGNPDPNNYKILSHWSCGKFLVIKIKYPDCNNYEGKKILVYKNTTLEDLIKQKSIDPHFSNNKKYKSPIARFEPTDEGLRMALDFVFFETK